MDGDIVRDDVRVCQDVALPHIHNKGAAGGGALRLRLPWLRVVGLRPLDEDCMSRNIDTKAIVVWLWWQQLAYLGMASWMRRRILAVRT